MKPNNWSEGHGKLRSIVAVSAANTGKSGTSAIRRPIVDAPPAKTTADRSCMEGLLSLWLFTLCFYYPALPFFTIHLGVNFTPDRFLFGVVIITFFIRRRAGKTVLKPTSKLEYLMLLFAIASTISWAVYGADANADGPIQIAGATIQRKFRALTTLFTICFQPFTIYSIARRLQWDRPAITRLLYAMGGIGTYLGFTGIVEHFGTDFLVFPKYILDPVVGTQFGRARGPFAAAVVNGGALIVTFLSLVMMWASNKKSTFAALMILPVCVTIYFTDTRGVWVGFSGVIALLAVTRSRMRKPVLVIVAFALAVFVSGAFSKFSPYETSLFSRRDKTVSYRFANYEVLLGMFMKNPIFGIGYGNFDKHVDDYYVSNRADVRAIDDGNNTTILGILGELGIVGLVLYAAILSIAAKICVSAYRYMNSDELAFERQFAIASFGVLQTFLLMGVTTDMRYHGFFNVAVFLYLGIVSSVHAAALSMDRHGNRLIERNPVYQAVFKARLTVPETGERTRAASRGLSLGRVSKRSGAPLSNLI